MNRWLSPNAFAELSAFRCFFFYRNANEYPPLTTSDPNPSQLIPPFSVWYDLTLPSKVEQFGRCKGLPTMERFGEGRTRAVTGNGSMEVTVITIVFINVVILAIVTIFAIDWLYFMLISASWSEVLGGDAIICGGRTRLARSPFCTTILRPCFHNDVFIFVQLCKLLLGVEYCQWPMA